MIGKTIPPRRDKILEKLPSTEFILNEVEGLRTSGEDGSPREIRNVNIMDINIHRKLGWLGNTVSLNISRGKWVW